MEAHDSAASNHINLEGENQDWPSFERVVARPAQRFHLVRPGNLFEQEMVEPVMEDDEEFVDEARMEGTNGQNIFPFTQYFQPRESEFRQSFTESPGPARQPRERKPFPGIKKDRKKNGSKVDMPPTPWGCEWRRTDDGWQLWRCWTERDDSTGEKIKKSRYTGCLSLDAWQVMKGYDYETFISTLGQRFRRYGKR